jgi:hypothetical protein
MRGLMAGTVVVAVVAGAITHAQERVAAYESLDVPRSSPRVTFAPIAPAAGDRVDQTLTVALDLESTVRQGDQELDKSTTSMVRQQDRTVIVEQVVDGRTVAARVRFAKCERSIDQQTSQPPVVGKTYLCHRVDDETLRITRADGSLASPEEFSIVSESMDSLGRPNPLADFLAGKTVAVGDVLEVPLEIGAELLGSNESLGHVSKFNLELQSVDATEGVAKFAVEMETQGSEKTQMRLIVTGGLDVEIKSCRTRRLAISGPMGMATTMGSYSTAQTTYVRGKLKLSMSAEYY